MNKIDYTGWLWSEADDAAVYYRNGELTESYVSGTLLYTRESPADPEWLQTLRKEIDKQRREAA